MLIHKLIAASTALFLGFCAQPASAAVEDFYSGQYIDEYSIIDDSGQYAETDDGLMYEPDWQSMPSFNYPAASDLGGVDHIDETDLNQTKDPNRKLSL